MMQTNSDVWCAVEVPSPEKGDLQKWRLQVRTQVVDLGGGGGDGEAVMLVVGERWAIDRRARDARTPSSCSCTHTSAMQKGRGIDPAVSAANPGLSADKALVIARVDFGFAVRPVCVTRRYGGQLTSHCPTPAYRLTPPWHFMMWGSPQPLFLRPLARPRILSSVQSVACESYFLLAPLPSSVIDPPLPCSLATSLPSLGPRSHASALARCAWDTVPGCAALETTLGSDPIRSLWRIDEPAHRVHLMRFPRAACLRLPRPSLVRYVKVQ